MKKSDVEAQQQNNLSTSDMATSSGLNSSSTLRNNHKQVKFANEDNDDDDDEEIERARNDERREDFNESDNLLRRKSSSGSGILKKFMSVGTPEFNSNVIESSNTFAEGLHHDKEQFLSNKFEVFKLKYIFKNNKIFIRFFCYVIF